jgi:hypothetical protein
LQASLNESADLIEAIGNIYPGKIDTELTEFLRANANHAWLLEKLMGEMSAQRGKIGQKARIGAA